MPSLTRNTLSRLFADLTSLAVGLITGVVTARWLGPDGKGVLSSLTYLSVLIGQACCLGLQEASIVMIGQKRATRQEALSATVAATTVTTAVGVLILWGVCGFEFWSQWPEVRPALVASCALLAAGAFSNVLCGMVNSLEKIAATSAVLTLVACLSALGTWLLVVVVSWSVLGGILGAVIGSAAGVAVLVAVLRANGLSVRPRWDWAYLAAALPYGIGIQASYLLTIMSARMDLLVVYELAGPAAAGRYSVALTLGALVGMAPAAISIATFPRLAHLGEAEAMALVARTCRYGVWSSLSFAVVLAALAPVLIPLAFGQAFEEAVVPSLILFIGGVPWSLQWLLARSAAARGWPWLLASSFGLSLVVMLALDVVLIPPYGIIGAALASSVAPVCGLAVCVTWYHRRWGDAIRFLDLLPCLADLGPLVAIPRSIFMGRVDPAGPP
jgi:O-antigen/teichoic acid export membrane protein